jgi:leader peptidase (prepilin peptidase)/N-methyltransferase
MPLLPIWFSAAVAGAIGLVVGSFLNVVTYRLPAGRSLASPGSSCPHCAAPIRAWDNVPVLSWLVLGGRCRSCQAPISWQYPAVELITGGLFAAVGARFPWSPLELALLVFVAAGVVVAVIDIRERVIPTKVVWAAGLTGLGLLALASLTAGSPGRLGLALAGAAASFVSFYLIWYLRPGGIGFGDVRFAALLGLFVGWLGPGELFVALFAACLSGAAVGVPWAIIGGGGRRLAIPFGPFLVVGSLVGILAGPQLVHLWLG